MNRTVEVRVLTYNILRGGQRGAPLDEVVVAVRPDVLLVNEAPKAPLWWRWRAHVLARRWGLRPVAGGRPAGSNLILVGPRVQVRSRLQRAFGVPFGQPRRGMASARLSVDGRELTVISVHLALDPPSRLQQAALIVELAHACVDPVLLAGDLNETPGSPSWRLFEDAGLCDVGDQNWLTFPSDAPRTRIDAVLLRGAAAAAPAGDPGVDTQLLARASDHRPVLARVLL